MSVLLINPPSSYLTDPAFVPPLGLLYLSTALEAEGIEAQVCDLNLPGAALPYKQFDLIGITCTTANFASVKKIAQRCREWHPDTPIVVGGPHLSVKPEDYSKLGASWYTCGDGEQALVRLAQALSVHRPPTTADVSDGAQFDVNRIPWPSRHFVPITQYSCAVDGRRATTLVTQRGCPFACAFCSRWEQTRRVRARAIENVAEEVQYLKRLGFSSLVFHDDEINLLEKRLVLLCRALAPEHVTFKANARADLLTEQQVEALAEAGCSWLCFGVESGSTEILKTVAKGTTPDVNARARMLCRKYGIRFKAFVIVGLPGESWATVEQTKRWLIENEVDDLTVTMFVPFPGSAVYDHPEKYDIQFTLPYEEDALPFRGGRGLELPHVVSTSCLDAATLAALPEILEAEVREALGLLGATAARTVPRIRTETGYTALDAASEGLG